ncbi:hypothetical protein BH10ACT7_BH10ACT7_23440 [soil metagenome]
MTRTRSRLTRARAVAVGVAFVLAASLGAAPALETSPAWAVEYPTWEDLAAARRDEASAQAAIKQIEALLVQLAAAVEAARADEEVKGGLWREADDKFQAAAQRTLTLQSQADEAAARANQSGIKASQMAAQLVRTGSQDLTATLFTSTGGETDNLLYYMGMSAKVSEQASVIYEAALLDRNTAQALSDQADVAEAELDILREAAETAFEEAQAATIAAANAVAEQEAHEAELEAQLVVLTERRAATEADYNKGEQVRAAARAAEAARLAALYQSAGTISNSGWALPVSGRITSSFGYRSSPTSGASSNHQGTDIGARCGAPIYAAYGGTVTYSGWNGGYGNFILINHGGGYSTAYAHIVNGGLLVGYGSYVSAGQHIALVGTTGTSTGCHLHFETRHNGVAFNSVPFMAERGIRIG